MSSALFTPNFERLSRSTQHDIKAHLERTCAKKLSDHQVQRIYFLCAEKYQKNCRYRKTNKSRHSVFDAERI